MRAMLAREIAKPEADDNTFGKFGAMLTMGMIDSMVEGFITPESIAAMVEEGRMTKPGQANAQAPAAKPADWEVERNGFAEFTAKPNTVDGKPGPGLVFERDGLGWKLSGLKLPPDATAKP